MRCPFCKKYGALIDKEIVFEKGESIHSVITCKNQLCSAYDLILYGPHPNMTSEKKAEFEKYLNIIDNESDFDIIDPRMWRLIK